METDQEECYWEIGKFIRLGLKANPNILECLYSPVIETCTSLAGELIQMRHIFLSKHVHRTYNSYVLSQFKKLEQDLRNQHEVRWKHVMDEALVRTELPEHPDYDLANEFLVRARRYAASPEYLAGAQAD